MDKLTVFSPLVVTGQNGEQDNVERIEASSILQPGTYWRVKREPMQPPTHDERYVWRPSYAKGEMLLLMDVKDDENGYAHNVELLLTPERQSLRNSRPNTVNLMVDFFHEEFEYVENGEEIRRQQTEEQNRKLMTVQEDISDIQSNPQRLMQELSTSEDEDLVKVKERLSKLKALPSPDAGTNLANMNDAEDAKLQLEAKVEIAQATAVVLTKVQEKLSNEVEVIGSYHGEVGHLALARTKEARELVGRVNTALDTLGIYLGTDVDVEPVREGESGNPDEKFRLYQDMLYMDEESLIHAGSGGADHADIGTFLENLSKDDELVERIFPFNRCMVIIRPRRKSKEYHGEHPFEAARRNRLNKLSFLLIRNGDNINAVFHPMGFLSKLFPSQEEMDSSFKTGGFDCRNVTKDDLEYTKSLSLAEKLSRQYKRLVLLLQGIYERDETGLIFGEMPVEGNLHLLNPMHQAAVFDFVSMESIIEDTRMPPYKEWFKSLNEDMRVGSLVFLARGHVDSDSTPGAYSRGEYSSEIYSLDDPTDFYSQPHVLEKHGAKIGVKTLFNYTGWRDGSDRNLVIEVKPDDRTVIDLEKVRSVDIDHYLNSRREREYYAEYISVLQKLKAFALIEEERTQAMRDEVTKILSDSQREADEYIVFQAVMKYRANNKGKFADDAHTKPKEVEKVLNVYWQLTGGADLLVDKIKDAMTENVVAIVSDAKNTVFVFTESDARALEWDKTGFKWLSRYKLENKDTMRFGKPVAQRISDIQGKMTYLYRSEEFNAIEEKQNNAHSRSMRQIQNWNKKVDTLIEDNYAEFYQTMNSMVAGEMTLENFNKLCVVFTKLNDELYRRVTIRTAKRKIHLPILSIPMGLLVMEDGKQYALRTNVNTKQIIKYFATRGPVEERNEWLELGRKTILYMGNESQAKEVGNEVEYFSGSLYASSLADTNSGTLSRFYENPTQDSEWALELGESKHSWYNILYLENFDQVYGIDGFLTKYPALSEVIKTRVHDKEKVSLKDLRGTVERAKLEKKERK